MNTSIKSLCQNLLLNTAKSTKLLFTFLAISGFISFNAFAADYEPIDIDDDAPAEILPQLEAPMARIIREENWTAIKRSLQDDLMGAEKNEDAHIINEKHEYLFRLQALKMLINREADKAAILRFASTHPINAQLVFGVYGNDGRTFTAKELDEIKLLARMI